MNGRRSKALRKLAQLTTIGMPERKYTTLSTGEIRLTQCTRAQYRHFKRTLPASTMQVVRLAHRMAHDRSIREKEPAHTTVVRIPE